MPPLLSVKKILTLYLETYNFRTDLPIGVYRNEKYEQLYTQKAIDDLPDFCKYVEKDPLIKSLCDEDHKRRANCLKKDPLIKSLCDEDHKRRANCLNGPVCEYCHFGIANYKYPIIVNCKHYGTILTGKRRILGNEEEELKKFKKTLGMIEESCKIDATKKEEMICKFNAVKKIPLKDFRSSCETILRNVGSFFEEVLIIRENAIKTENNRALSIQLAAHELIGPLVSIKGDAELLEELLDPLSDKEKILICRSIWNATERMRVFADNLRSGIDIEGDYKFQIESLYRLIRNCILPYETMAKEKGIIIIKPKIEPFDIKADIALEEFELALKNLIHNAVKYSYFGTDREPRYVEIIGNLSKNKGYYEISISNLGVGIERDEIEKRTITKRFVRGKLSNDRERIGTGMGLYVVDKVITKHNGTLEFSSEFKGGPYLNTFTIKFPLQHENGG